MTDESLQPPSTAEPAPASRPEPAQWLAGLVQGHYIALYRLALAHLEDEPLSRQVALTALAGALQKHNRYSRRSDFIWLYELALKEIQQKSRQPSAAEPTQPPSDLDAAIWKLVDSFEGQERLLCILLYLLEWQIVLHVWL